MINHELPTAKGFNEDACLIVLNTCSKRLSHNKIISSQSGFNHDVPQGSIIGPFNIYINDRFLKNKKILIFVILQTTLFGTRVMEVLKGCQIHLKKKVELALIWNLPHSKLTGKVLLEQSRGHNFTIPTPLQKLKQQSANRIKYCPLPDYQFLENFIPKTFLFHTPRSLNLEKCSSQDIFKSRRQ